jgi:hypothetical protein
VAAPVGIVVAVVVDKQVVHNYLRKKRIHLLVLSSLMMDQAETILSRVKERILQLSWLSVDQVNVVVVPIPGKGRD